jgi:hypothetical protein
MKRSLLLAVALVSHRALALGSAECPVALSVECAPSHIDVTPQFQRNAEGQTVEYALLSPGTFQVTLRNLGSQAVTLVHPGDGSAWGRRTPILRWTVDGRPLEQTGMCGNMNPLRPGEIFVLQPGESAELLAEWIPSVVVHTEGSHRLQLRYENDPELRWDGGGQHDVAAMEQVRKSTPCRIDSNVAECTVRFVQRGR